VQFSFIALAKFGQLGLIAGKCVQFGLKFGLIAVKKRTGLLPNT